MKIYYVIFYRIKYGIYYRILANSCAYLTYKQHTSESESFPPSVNTRMLKIGTRCHALLYYLLVSHDCMFFFSSFRLSVDQWSNARLSSGRLVSFSIVW